MTCQSFSSVSLDPPLVLFIPAKTSRAWPLIQRSGKFCVNFLAADQAELSNTMASRGADKFADVKWTPSPRTGSPMLEGALAHVDCTIHAVHEAGDHYVVIGRVVDLVTDDDGDDDPAAVLPGEVPHHRRRAESAAHRRPGRRRWPGDLGTARRSATAGSSGDGLRGPAVRLSGRRCCSDRR